ncbi:hypothetical protein D9M73_123800 [compost metagenome]
MWVATGAQCIGLRADRGAPGVASTFAARDTGVGRVDQSGVAEQRGVRLQNGTCRAVGGGGLPGHVGDERGMGGGEGGLLGGNAAPQQRNFWVNGAVMPYWPDREARRCGHARKRALGHISAAHGGGRRRGRRGRFVHAAGDQRDQRIERGGAVAALRGQRDRIAMPNAQREQPGRAER